MTGQNKATIHEPGHCLKVLSFLLIFSCLALSCTRKSNFVNMGKTGNGMHYYPIILNDNLFDTVTKKYLNLTDTTFSRSQQIIFEVDFFSRDTVSGIQLWAGKSLRNLQMAIDTPFQSGFYSPAKQADTFLFHYTIPAGIDSAAHQWILEPRIVTKSGLQDAFNATIQLQ